jgi:hypothetical protein
MFVIRKKGTENFILETGRGSTWHEARPLHEGRIRFFNTIGAAKGFLTIWCQGALDVTRSTSYDGWTEDYDEVKKVLTEYARLREDYEILAVSLQLDEVVA